MCICPLQDEVESSCISLSTSSNGKYLLAAGRAATGQRIVRALPLSPAEEGAIDAAWILLGPASDPDSMPNMVSSTPSSESDPDGGDRTSQEAGGDKSSSSSSTGYGSDDNVKNDIDRRDGSRSSSTHSLPDYDVLRADHWQQVSVDLGQRRAPCI